MDLLNLTVAGTAAAYRKGELSPLEVTEATLAQIERINPRLNAYLTITAESALAQAKEATDAFRRGEDRGPLQGIPLSFKDLYDVAGVRTTAGSIILKDNIANADATVVAQVRAQGAVLLGKTHMHEWALGITNVNPHFGPVHNPWNLDMVPGGSSGGSGAALAAGLCVASFGSDTGGSIRIPSSLCGTVGLKPTRGRMSLRGVIPLSWSLDTAGPMARSVEDCAILLQATAGYDPEDPLSVYAPVGDYLGGLRNGVDGVRVLVPTNFFYESSEPEVAALVRAAVEELKRLGACAQPVEFPGAEEMSVISGHMNVSDACTVHAEHMRERPDDIGGDVMTRLRIGEGKTARDYATLRQQQREWRRTFENALRGDTVIAVPTTPIPAFPIEGTEAVAAARRLTSLTAPFNLTGVPAISVPCGFTAAGLPVGLQIAAHPWNEALALRVAYAYEQATEWHKRHPLL